MGTLGFEDSDMKSFLLLNRVSRFGVDQTGQYLDFEADLRHAPLIISESGCNTNTMRTQQAVQIKESRWIGSDTIPLRHRPDFKQALSTLQQVKEKEEGAQRRQRWAQSSSSSWWSWQGSWWTLYSYESHHGDEPSTD